MCEWLTTGEVGELMKLSPTTVAEMCRKGKLPGRKIGRDWRIRKRDYEAYCGVRPDEPQEPIKPPDYYQRKAAI